MIELNHNHSITHISANPHLTVHIDDDGRRWLVTAIEKRWLQLDFTVSFVGDLSDILAENDYLKFGERLSNVNKDYVREIIDSTPDLDTAWECDTRALRGLEVMVLGTLAKNGWLIRHPEQGYPVITRISQQGYPTIVRGRATTRIIEACYVIAHAAGEYPNRIEADPTAEHWIFNGMLRMLGKATAFKDGVQVTKRTVIEIACNL